MMARASGAYCSLPVPSFSAMGIMPMMVASEVIKMGRSRTRQEVITASSTDWPLLLQAMRELDDQDAVGGGDADQHQHAHERHHVQGCVGQRQDDQHTDEAHGDRQHDEERILEGTELRNQNQEQQHD